jgi:hypothetical protein
MAALTNLAVRRKPPCLVCMLVPPVPTSRISSRQNPSGCFDGLAGKTGRSPQIGSTISIIIATVFDTADTDRPIVISSPNIPIAILPSRPP